VTPTIEGKTHHFAEHGLYDGLFLMRDEESGTYWDHLTGEAVYGTKVGTRLEITPLDYSLAGQVLENHPQALITLSDQVLWDDEALAADGILKRRDRGLSQMFSSTVEKEDDRLPTMEIGVGIWSEEKSKYYPYLEVIDAGKAVLDDFGGRKILVVLDPETQVLSAFYVEAESFEWRENDLHLSNGQILSNSLIRNSKGEPLPVERPLQTFTRWYGFSLTFPGTEIYKN
jgi:hypothetical protein